MTAKIVGNRFRVTLVDVDLFTEHPTPVNVNLQLSMKEEGCMFQSSLIHYF